MKTGIVLLLFTFCLNTEAQNFKKHVLFLASDSLHGRAPATADEEHAADYIATQLGLAACRTAYQQFPFRDSSQKFPAGYPVRDSAVNVIGFLDLGKDSTIIISAHYDHLGYGSNKSLEIVKKGIYHGADDNASGVAMMIELAEFLSSGHRWKYNFFFAAYSGHEAGLSGSAYFAQSKSCRDLKIRAVINFDMVGRLDTASKVLRVSGAATDSAFYRVFHNADNKSFWFNFDDDNISHSDLNSFDKKNIPLLNITTGTHDDYHRIGDTENKINYNGMLRIYALMLKLLGEVASAPR